MQKKEKKRKEKKRKEMSGVGRIEEKMS